jgi:hypothetical protein
MRVRLSLAAISIGLLATSFVGCGKSADKKDGNTQAGDDHDHPDKGPRGGMLVELGNEEYHAEIVHDDAAHKVTIYVLDAKVKDAVSITDKDVKINVVVGGAPAQFVLPAVPLDGETDGKSSRFESVDEKLAEALDAKGADARLKLNINGAPYEGKFGAHEH